ncbi:50S ribosomal protein L23 [Candidatus Uhrbacteria bacterium RIFOXYB12_FULL_58_10]|uniref:Large ribosomal subunit protein uL23 n=1 Tax=Candidatus Uhrbacteria bacterium RIFOXYB2_FULL_57_15 TaxID=1802422 RepID=A0A1F7WA48_9BACT|nr:MAG: 50S ribosomal protein L23 [Candidatus Uhrbacteria bacterium RIFOXYB12_FULL_58_10]OGL99067.1 MAG: 50S ribosomal protein L23 [Candidatus Uhrbacteria bacterium RIFOXYB2_FULL_57_15]OGM00306.1 MAG: 50S ribosomal protein L23 [Candidatus Uhrbacteria bacterium RIFOXYC12_FULL_57_11]
MSTDLSGTIVRPLVTEKAAIIAHVGQYSFLVAPNANRVAVRAAIKAMYGVIPTSVNIQRVRGKFVRFGRTVGQRSDWKKAIVTLPKGKTIDVYEGV